MSCHILYGDSYLVNQQMALLKAGGGAEGLLEANHHRLLGSQINSTELLNVCNALPFLDSCRLVVVNGLLGVFEPRPGRGQRRNSDSHLNARPLTGWEGLGRAISEMPETTVLVLTDGPISANNPLLRLLRPVSQVQVLTTPGGEALARWIKASAEQKGASISPPAIGCLTDHVGGDLWALDRELEKLSLYAEGRRIEESHVTELVHQAREANIFAAVDAMIEGRQSRALHLLHQLRQDGREATSIIALVERQLRLLALARDAMDRGVPQRELAGVLGVSSPYVVRKTVEQARRHSWEDILWRYRRLLEADLDIKQGRLEPDLALELLAADQAARSRR